MKNAYPFLLFVFFLMLSCDKSAVYEKTNRDFKNNRWYKTDIKTHTVEIGEEADYSLFLNFRHVYDFQFPEVIIQVKTENPDGTFTLEKMKLKIKDETDKDKGECMGDVCDLQQAVFTARKMQKGTYSIDISHQFDGEYLPNVLGVGLVLKKSQ